MADEQNQVIMSRFEKDGHSFLIRIWRENRDNPMKAGDWRGWIQHVQSKQKKHFKSTEDIPKIINRYLNEEPAFEQIFEPVQEDKKR